MGACPSFEVQGDALHDLHGQARMPTGETTSSAMILSSMLQFLIYKLASACFSVIPCFGGF